jgi:HEAT repeat protein
MPPRKSPSGPATGAMADSADPTSWETWWWFNKDRFLELKAHVAVLEVSTGSDAEFLGQGGVAQDAAGTRVVPALLAMLEKERSNDVVTGATVALARMADGPLAARASELAKVFAGFAEDPNQEIAETSVLARGIVGDDASAMELVDLLENGDAARARRGGHEVNVRTRAFAGFALGLLGAHSKNEDLRRFVVHHLVRTLREDKGAMPDVQVACVTALGLTPLAWSQSGNDVRSPANAAAARRSTGAASASRETQIECLLAQLADTGGDRYVRAHVPTALARLADGAGDGVHDEIARALLERIPQSAHEKDEVVQGCVLALGTLGDADRDDVDTRMRAVLENAVVGADQLARRFALIALAEGASRRGRHGSLEATPEVRQFLARRLSDGRSHERCWAAIALGVLEHELARPNLPAENAADAKSELGSVNIRAQVLAALRDAGSGTEVGALAISIGLMRDTSATPILLAKLERTAETSTQGHIAVALGLVGDATAAPALREQLATARFRPDLLRDTAIGMALIEDPTLVPSLIETLEKASSLASQSAAASVLGWIGDRRTIDPLLSLAGRREATATARAFAAVALGRVCDQDRMPWNAAVAQDFNYGAATVTLTSGDGTGILDIL